MWRRGLKSSQGMRMMEELQLCREATSGEKAWGQGPSLLSPQPPRPQAPPTHLFRPPFPELLADPVVRLPGLSLSSVVPTYVPGDSGPRLKCAHTAVPLAPQWGCKPSDCPLHSAAHRGRPQRRQHLHMLTKPSFILTKQAPTVRHAPPWALERHCEQDRQAAPGVGGGSHSQLCGPGQDGRHSEQDASVGARFELGRKRNERLSGPHLRPLTSLGATAQGAA